MDIHQVTGKELLSEDDKEGEGIDREMGGKRKKACSISLKGLALAMEQCCPLRRHPRAGVPPPQRV